MNRLRAAWAVLCGRPVAYRLVFNAQARVAWRRQGLMVDCTLPHGGLEQRRVSLPGGAALLVIEPLGEHEAKARERAERDARWNAAIDAELDRPFGAPQKGGVA